MILVGGAETYLLRHHYAMEDTFGNGKRQIQNIVRVVANRPGIGKPVSPHVLRHSFSMMCLKREIGLRTLQTLLGHDNIQTTEIYMTPPKMPSGSFRTSGKIMKNIFIIRRQDSVKLSFRILWTPWATNLPSRISEYGCRI